MRSYDYMYDVSEEFAQYKEQVQDNVIELLDLIFCKKSSDFEIEVKLEELCDAAKVNFVKDWVDGQLAWRRPDQTTFEQYKNILSAHFDRLKSNQLQPMDGTYA